MAPKRSSFHRSQPPRSLVEGPGGRCARQPESVGEFAHGADHDPAGKNNLAGVRTNVDEAMLFCQAATTVAFMALDRAQVDSF